jgi:hypothetical protein
MEHLIRSAARDSEDVSEGATSISLSMKQQGGIKLKTRVQVAKKKQVSPEQDTRHKQERYKTGLKHRQTDR